MTTIVDKVKLVLVHRDSPDVETELGTFPSKDAAMPAFQEAIAKHDADGGLIHSMYKSR
jgi:hypothetical protein